MAFHRLAHAGGVTQGIGLQSSMDLQIPLPIRLATTSSFEETTATPETPDPPSTVTQAPPGPAQSLSPNPLIADHRAAGPSRNVPVPSSPDLRGYQAATGSSNHQFWLKDAKVAEELFTVRLLLLSPLATCDLSCGC